MGRNNDDDHDDCDDGADYVAIAQKSIGEVGLVV